ncbi:MAG0480 family ComEC-like protein [Mycoplasmopsis meleagridis]|uniref:MAG0480 family ComEC-like protein n=1 Tax=Mycoplasmopsis meleagridis TaxID=29561 RepID=UPI00061522E0
MRWIISYTWIRWKNFREVAKKFFNLKSYIYFLLSILISFLLVNAVEYWYFFILPFSILLIINLLKNKWLFLLNLIILIYFIAYKIIKYEKIDENIYYINANIRKSYEKYFLINYKNQNIIVFHNYYSKNLYIPPFSNIEIEGKIIPFKLNNSNLFLWKKEYNINYQLIDYSIKNIIRPKISLQDQLINNLNSNLPYFNRYWAKIVFGINNENNLDFNDNINQLGISHIFVISGFHLDILFVVLTFHKFKNKKIDIFYNSCIFTFIFLYITLLFNPISAIRAFIMKLIDFIYKMTNKGQKINTFSSLIIAAFLLWVINNNWIYSLSYYFTISNTFWIIFFNKLLRKNEKLRDKKIFSFFILMNIICLINAFNIAIINSNISWLNIFWNLLFSPIIEIVYIFSILFWWSDYFLNFVFFLLDRLLIFANSINLVTEINYVFDLNYLYLYFQFLLFTVFLIKVIAYRIKNKKLRL